MFDTQKAHSIVLCAMSVTYVLIKELLSEKIYIVHSQKQRNVCFVMCFYQPILYIIHNGDPFEQEFTFLLIALYGL